MDPPTDMMDLPTGWAKATYRHGDSGEIRSYYFNKQTGLTSHIPPPPIHHEDGDDSPAEEDMNKTIQDLRLHFPQHPRELDSDDDDMMFNQ
jgi:hypothetical protein